MIHPTVKKVHFRTSEMKYVIIITFIRWLLYVRNYVRFQIHYGPHNHLQAMYYYHILNLRKLSLRGTVKQSHQGNTLHKWQGQDSNPLTSNSTFHSTRGFLSFYFHSVCISISVAEIWGSLGTSNTVLSRVCLVPTVIF